MAGRKTSLTMTLYKHRVGDPRAASQTILTYIISIIYYNTQLTNSVHSIYHVSPSHCLQTAIIIGRYSITMCLIIFRGGRAVMMGGNCGNRPVITRCGSTPLGGICSIHNLINSPFEQTNRWLIFTLPCFLSPNPLTGRVKLNYNGSSGWRRHR